MPYKDNQKELKQAAERMEHHAEDYHPELDWDQIPRGIDQGGYRNDTDKFPDKEKK